MLLANAVQENTVLSLPSPLLFLLLDHCSVDACSSVARWCDAIQRQLLPSLAALTTVHTLQEKSLLIGSLRRLLLPEMGGSCWLFQPRMRPWRPRTRPLDRPPVMPGYAPAVDVAMSAQLRACAPALGVTLYSLLLKHCMSIILMCKCV